MIVLTVRCGRMNIFLFPLTAFFKMTVIINLYSNQILVFSLVILMFIKSKHQEKSAKSLTDPHSNNKYYIFYPDILRAVFFSVKEPALV